MNKYKDSFETRSESLEQGGKGIMTAVKNEDAGVPENTTNDSKPYGEYSKNSSTISPIRTLADDLEQSVKNNDVTLSQQALAKAGAHENTSRLERGPEANQRTKKYKKKPLSERKRISWSLGFLFFTLIVFGASLYLFTSRQDIDISAVNLPGLGSLFNQETVVDSPTPLPTLLVQVDNVKELVLTSGMGRAEIRRILNEESRESDVGTLTAFLLRESVETEGNAKTETADITSLLDIIDPSIYSVLSRNINEYTLGASGGGEARAFLVAKIISYEEIFGALLAWERAMPRELYGFFHDDVNIATRNGESSFSDTIVAGFDARVLTKVQQIMNEDGGLSESEEDVLIYSIINKETLIITHSREELARIISRLQ